MVFSNCFSFSQLNLAPLHAGKVMELANIYTVAINLGAIAVTAMFLWTSWGFNNLHDQRDKSCSSWQLESTLQFIYVHLRAQRTNVSKNV